MKQLMIDYWRRKSVVLLFGAVMEFVMGMLSAVQQASHNHPWAPIQIQIGIFLGPFLLSIDLQRGLTRTVTALPLTARQIARAWWLATVAVPAAAFTALMYAGAAFISLFKNNAHSDWVWLGVAGLVLFLWMGSTFTMIFATGYGGAAGWRRTINIAAGSMWGLMIGGGMWMLGLVFESPVRTGCLIAFGVILTAVGWLWSEQLVRGKAAFRLGSQTGGTRSGQVRLQNGYGAIPFLMMTTVTRALMFGVGMVLIMGAIFFLQGGSHYDWAGAVKTLLDMGFIPFWFVTFISLMPALMQLRFLRSLPISATSLALILVGMAVLPLLMLGALMVGLIGAVLGTGPALQFASTFLLTIPMAAFCVTIFAWLGNSTLSALVAWPAIIAFQVMSIFFGMHHRLPLSAVAAIVTGLVFIFTWLVRMCLLQGSRAYRIQANIFGGANWWQTR